MPDVLEVCRVVGCGALVAVRLTNSAQGYCRNHREHAYAYNRGMA